MAFSRKLLSIIAVASLAASPVASKAVGVFNMPTNLRQCFGVGFGPGYHANMVLGPPWKAGAEGKHVRYVWNAPQPPAPSGFAAPTAIDAGCGVGGCGLEAYMASPPSYGATATPAMQPTPAYPAMVAPLNAGSYETVPAPAMLP